MIGALAVAATLLIGPEQPVPSPINEPVAVLRYGPRLVDVARAGSDFVVVWYSGEAIWLQRLDGGSGEPFARTATRLAIVPFRSQVTYPEPRVASNGNVSVMVWEGAKSLFAVTVSRDGSATPPRKIGVSSDDVTPAITSFGDEFLIAWGNGKDTAGIFLDASGGASGPQFTIAPGKQPEHGDGLALASNGSNAFVATGNSTFIVRPGGSVQAGVSFFSAYDSRAVWDGRAYVLAMKPFGLQIAAFDEGGNLLRPPLDAGYAGTRITLSSNGNGSVVISDYSYYGDILRLAPGGADIVSRTHSPYSFQDVYGAAWNGTKYMLAASRTTPIETTFTSDLQSFSDPQPVALQHATQSSAAITADDRYLFAGASGSAYDVVTRFDGRSFLSRQTVLPSGAITLGHDQKHAAAFVIGSPDVLGMEIDDDGGASAPVTLGYGSSGPASYTSCGVVPVANTFLAIWSRYAPDQPGALISHTTLYSGSFDQPFTGVARDFFGPILGGGAALVPRGDHAIAAVFDSAGVVWVVDVDRNGKMISPAVAVSGAELPIDVSMAADSDGHLLILWTLAGSQLAKGVVIDATSRQIVSRIDQLPFRGPVKIAWNGASFLVLTSAGLIELSDEGTILGSQTLDSPFDLYNLGIASGPPGTAIVYTRDAPDLGDGGTRAFVRMVAPPARDPRERPLRPGRALTVSSPCCRHPSSSRTSRSRHREARRSFAGSICASTPASRSR